MKILVIPSFHFLHGDIKPKTPKAFFPWEQTQLFRKYGIDVDYLYNEERSFKDFSLWNNLKNIKRYHFQSQKYILDGIEVFLRHGYRFMPSNWRISQKIWIKNTISLFETTYLKEKKLPDIIHIHFSLPASEVAYYIKKKYGVPFTILENASMFGTGHYKRKDLSIIKKTMIFADKVFCVSTPFQALLAEKLQLPQSHFTVIPNFVDTEYFTPLMTPSNQRKEDFTFLCVCHLEKKKRVDRLIKAFLKTFSGCKDVRLRIGGTGSEKKDIINLINSIDSYNQITMLGPLSREDVRSEMNKIDVFVLPSDVETFGIVLVEALAMGKPVIGTRCGGPEDIISDSVGILVNKTEEDMATALLNIKNNYDKYPSGNLIQYAESNFGAKMIVERYKTEFEKIML